MDKWIRASEAVKRLAGYQGGEIAAAQLIEERVGLQLLTGRASRRIETRRIHLAPDKVAVVADEEVPAWVWGEARRQTYAKRLFDWRGERYTAWSIFNPERASESYTKMEFVGLEFLEHQIDSLLPLTGDDSRSESDKAAPAKQTKGRKADNARWQAFWFALITIAQDGRLRKESFESRTELSDEILSLMGDGAFSPDYVKSVVSQIFAKFIGD